MASNLAVTRDRKVQPIRRGIVMIGLNNTVNRFWEAAAG